MDLGSNSVRLKIMKIHDDGSYYMLDEIKEMVRLSEGMAEHDNRLQGKAMQRTLSALKIFKKVLDMYQVEKLIAVATAAVRNSANGEEFLKMAKEKTGIELLVISGEREAYLDYLGVVNTTPLESFLLIDIGGASTEIGLVRERKLLEVTSIPIGAVNLTEKFQLSQAIPKEKEDNLHALIQGYLKDVGWLKEAKGLPIAALGGTVRTLAKIDKRLKNHPLEGIHMYALERNVIVDTFEKLISIEPISRNTLPGLNKERADIIVGGLAPLVNIIKDLDTKNIFISGNGLREGLFYEYLLEKETSIGAGALLPDVLEHNLQNIINYNDLKGSHIDKIYELSSKLYEDLKPILNLRADYGKEIYVASLLHDIGRSVNFYNRYYHSFYLILNVQLYGLSQKEKLIAAFIAGYDDSRAFKKLLLYYRSMLTIEECSAIKKLSLLLRLAHMLDRSEMGSVKDLDCKIENKRITLRLKAQGDLDLELASLDILKKQFFKAFNRKLEIKVKTIED
jgi:exopolyphosphatase/guanosine-5'-triphosphate,3'-diphosphate pyrophosphatase